MDDHGNIRGEVGETIGMSGRSYYIRHLTFVLRVCGRNSRPLFYVGYLRGLNWKQVPLPLAGQAWRCRMLPLAHLTVAGFHWSLQFTHGRIKRHDNLGDLELFVSSRRPFLFVF